jgi:hypothetical protein
MPRPLTHHGASSLASSLRTSCFRALDPGPTLRCAPFSSITRDPQKIFAPIRTTAFGHPRWDLSLNDAFYLDQNADTFKLVLHITCQRQRGAGTPPELST